MLPSATTDSGIAGVSRASILPVRVLNAKGYGRDANIASGIRWAANAGVDIINMSLGGASSGRILRDAVEYATPRACSWSLQQETTVARSPRYPAAFPDAVAVGATDLRDRMVWWSQHGHWLDLVAPGVKIASTVPDDRYAIGSGTSFSAPLVSGAAALLLSQHPRWTVDQLRDALLEGAADAGPVGPDPFTGLGVLDVDGMVGGAGQGRGGAAPGQRRARSPDNARPLQQDSVVPASSPEGTDRWFRLDVADPTGSRCPPEAESQGPCTAGRHRAEHCTTLRSAGSTSATQRRARNRTSTRRRRRHGLPSGSETSRTPDGRRRSTSASAATAANPANVEIGGAPVRS